jgi:hypothetical protein
LKQRAYNLCFEDLSNAPSILTCTLPYGIQSVHQIGELIGVLTEDLECILFNSLEYLVPAGTLKLGGFRGNIVDFAILDSSVPSPSSRMILHVFDGEKHEVSF